MGFSSAKERCTALSGDETGENLQPSAAVLSPGQMSPQATKDKETTED